MRPLFLVIQREIKERLGTRSARLFTAALFLLALASILAIDQIPTVFSDSQYRLGVVGEAPADLDEALDQAATELSIEIEVSRDAGRAAAEERLLNGEIRAYLVDGELVFRENESVTLTSAVNRALYIQRLPALLQEADITPEQAAVLLDFAPTQVTLLEAPDADELDRRFIGFAAALGLYITLALYGNWVLTGVVEEKTSRIVEVLLGLLRPHDLLAGKTIGIAVVAVTQLSAAVLGAFVGLRLIGADLLPPIAADVVIAALPLYILGVLLYCLIYAAVGATVTRQADAQSASTPIVMLLLIPYMYAAVFVPDNPDGPVATFLSIFPLTSPLVMPSRVATGSPDTLELIACYVLLPPMIMLVAWLGGRIYAAAIMSGRSMGMRGMLKTMLSSRSETT